MEAFEIFLDKIRIGNNNPFVLIAGPCVIENEKSAISTAKKLKNICTDLSIPFIYKSSFDKANRTSIKSYRGPGLIEGLKILDKIKKTLNVPILSDVHKEEEVLPASKVLDIIQIPAYLCRQTDLIIEAAKTDIVINIKKGQFLAPTDIKPIIEKIEYTGNKKILITERGTTFGYNNLVADFRSIPIMKKYCYPVIFDSTHSLQLPGKSGNSSDGQKEFIPNLARAAIAAGCDGIYMEIHSNPDMSPCDGSNMLKIDNLPPLLDQLRKINDIVTTTQHP